MCVFFFPAKRAARCAEEGCASPSLASRSRGDPRDPRGDPDPSDGTGSRRDAPRPLRRRAGAGGPRDVTAAAGMRPGMSREFNAAVTSSDVKSCASSQLIVNIIINIKDVNA